MKKLLIILILMLTIVGCTTTNETEDPIKDPIVDNNENTNEAKNITLAEILVKIDEKETFVIMFEMDGCPWCLEALPVYKDTATKNDANTYYMNFSDEQDKESFQEEFDQLVELLKDHIEFDGEGYPMFYVPSAYFFLNGEIVLDHTGTVTTHDPAKAKMTSEQIEELHAIYQEGYDLIQ